MATMKRPFRRVEINRLRTVAVALICGASLVVGINTIHPLTHQSSAPVIMPAVPSASAGVVGGRLGGISSADMANDALIRSRMSNTSTIPDPGQPPVFEELQERLESAAAQGDTAGTNVETVPSAGLPSIR